MKLTPADTLFDASEEFDMDTGEAVISDWALSSQVDEAALSNEAPSSEFSPSEDCGILVRTLSAEHSTSASAPLMTRSRNTSKIMR